MKENEAVREVERGPLVRLVDTGGEDVHHPYSAFNQGWDAREAGYPLELSPYDAGTREAHWWEMGWLDCRDGEGPPDPPSTQRVGPVARTRRAPASD